LTIACFLHRWDAARSPALCRNGVVPIGRPYEGLAAMIVDNELRPLPPGETGELCVTGRQTTPGYWRAPDKTAERFAWLPTSRHEQRRFYRTGDLVAQLPNGEYAFAGRVDQQIKVLGHRIELGEIEAALREHPGVEHAVAFGWPLASLSAESIVAFVSGDSPDPDAIIQSARTLLPPYAVPRQVLTLSEMPLNANGKVDRPQLRERLRQLPGIGDPKQTNG
jgi:acyl-CoA synthetase (AMP-forming)/AMP-acid ligase II